MQAIDVALEDHFFDSLIRNYDEPSILGDLLSNREVRVELPAEKVSYIPRLSHFWHEFYFHPTFEINCLEASGTLVSRFFPDPEYKVVIDVEPGKYHPRYYGTKSKEGLVLNHNSDQIVIRSRPKYFSFPEMPILELFETVGLRLTANDMEKSCTEVRVVGNNPPAYYYLHMPFMHSLKYHYVEGGEFIEPSDNVWEFLNGSRIILGRMESIVSSAIGSKDFETLDRMIQMTPKEYLDKISMRQTENNIRIAKRALIRRRSKLQSFMPKTQQNSFVPQGMPEIFQ